MNKRRNFKIWIYTEENENWRISSLFAVDKNNKEEIFSEFWKSEQEVLNIFLEKNIFFDEFQKIDWVFINRRDVPLGLLNKEEIKILWLEKNPIFIENWDEKNFEIKKAKEELEKNNCRDVSRKRLYGRKIHKKKKILLHICCWVDVIYPILTLKNKYELIAYWYDPNIHPECEYEKRFETFKEICDREWIEIIKWKYDAKNFLQKIYNLKNTPEKWEKCTVCYDYRLWNSAELAKEIWADSWTTTLNSSPLKSFEKLTKIWKKYEKKFWIPYLDLNFRKWQNETSEYCKKNNVYRQNYCWCIYSDTFPEKFDKEKIEKEILEK